MGKSQIPFVGLSVERGLGAPGTFVRGEEVSSSQLRMIIDKISPRLADAVTTVPTHRLGGLAPSRIFSKSCRGSRVEVSRGEASRWDLLCMPSVVAAVFDWGKRVLQSCGVLLLIGACVTVDRKSHL